MRQTPAHESIFGLAQNEAVGKRCQSLFDGLDVWLIVRLLVSDSVARFGNATKPISTHAETFGRERLKPDAVYPDG